MPRYRIDFDAEATTAKAVMEIMIDQVTNFTMSIVEEVHPLGEGGKGASPPRRRKIMGTNGSVKIFELAKSLDGAVGKSRISQMMLREGYNKNSVHAAISKLKMTDVVDVYDDGSIKLKNKTMTPETVYTRIKEYEDGIRAKK